MAIGPTYAADGSTPPGAPRYAKTGEQVVVPSPATVQERSTVPENPASADTLIVSVPVPPLLIVRDKLLADNVKSGFDGPFHAESNAETSTEPQPLATS